MNLPYQTAQINHNYSYLDTMFTAVRFRGNQNVQIGMKFSNQKTILLSIFAILFVCNRDIILLWE